MKTNADFLKEYLRKLKADGLCDKTRATAEHTLLHFIEWCSHRELCTFTVDDVYDYIDFVTSRTYLHKGVKCNCSPATICKEKTIVKKFLAYINPELGAVIKLKAPKNELPDILTPEEVEKLIDACITPRDKALISVFYESGARRGELLAVRLKHVTFDEYGSVISLPKSKTKTRRVRLVYAASYLRQFLECHPLKANREAFLFCSLHTPHGVISSSGLHYQLRCIAKRAGIPIEKVYPHNFRHSRATHLSEHLTEAQLKEMFGWVQGSSITGVYVHLAGSDIDRAILQMHGMAKEPEKKLTVAKCPRCKEINPESVSYCGKCGMPLKEEARDQIEKETADLDLDILKAAILNPEILKELEKRLNMDK